VANLVRTFRLLVAYDGTDFHGWQVQPECRTVQGLIEGALRDVLGIEAIRIAGAGRTDTGVHARGQVASFRADTFLPGHAFAPLLNKKLPPDVRVRESAETKPEFHARHSARGRRYAYRVIEDDDVLMRRFSWSLRRRPDWARIDRATRVLEGEADFAAFAAAGSTNVSPICRVRRARWRAVRGGARLDIVSDHFLYHMVRNIVGTVVRMRAGGDPAAAMRVILESRDRSRAGGTAPPQGLCLEQVEYETEDPA
jgi:tRNA pseudouridine38-40 synthase